MKKLFSAIRIVSKTAAAAVGMITAVVYSRECSKGIMNGISFCAEALVPSLFVFMALTAYIVNSGAGEYISRPFRFMSKLMRLPKEAITAVILAAVGGYPIGAGCVSSLYKNGVLSESEAAKTAYIAVAAGPGFIIGYVGRSLLNSPSAGNILLLSQISAVIVNGIIVGCTVKSQPPVHRKKPSESADNALVRSVGSAMEATFSMCSMVLIFSALIEVAGSLSDSRTADISAAFAEVTTGLNRLSHTVPLYVTAFFIGFGGLSVHFQIFAALKDIRINKLVFFLFRLSEGITASAFAYIFLMMTPAKAAVFSSTGAPVSAVPRAAAAGSVGLIFASVCFVGSITTRIRRIRSCAE